MTVRYFTPAEVDALLPRLRPLLLALQAAWHDHRFAEEQVVDLARMGGPTVDAADATGADREEAARWRARADELGARVEALAQEVRALGAELKDPAMGLVDFYALRRDGPVLLCYRADEPALRAWHPLTGGYGARRPLDDL